jgi:aspartate 1-decarboxylase
MGTDMKRTYIGGKLHNVRVTKCDVNYHGSITLDPVWMEMVGFQPYEQVHVLNVDNGARIVTYILPGERSQRQCELNGAAALLFTEGHRVLVLNYVEGDSFPGAKVLMFDEKNTIADQRRYPACS